MNIETRHLVLWVIASVQDRPNGKTYLQKMCFFVGHLLCLELGFRAHHYGPYSDLVSAEIGFLNANGYVFESRRHSGISDAQGWEVTRFDYELTDRGIAGVRWLDAQLPKESRQVRDAVERVLDAGDLNYIGLSLAAKTYWVLNGEGKPMTLDGVTEKASELRWTVSTDDVRRAADFLGKLRVASATGR